MGTATSAWRIGVVIILLAARPLAAQQPATPNLSSQERAALQMLIRAIDTDAPRVKLDEADWPLHVLRASDGSHYVAFSINRIEAVRAERPVAVYVRLMTRRTTGDLAPPERSAVAEWLAGRTAVPPLPQRGLAFGEMPTYGAAGIAQRGAGLQAQNLQILELERERSREKREAQERARKATLEGAEATRAPRPLLPFEDFDVRARAIADRTGGLALRRSLTSGPGEYELTVAWIDPESDAPAAVRVASRPLSLPPASTTTLALSTVIVADDVTVRDAPVAPSEQTGRPYSIGSTEITPARDHVLSADERLALVVQVINARGSPSGKPDVEVSFRVFRRSETGEENVGALAPQNYNELTLPVDFDTTKGHPIFAAVGVPLKSFRRGEYRMAISANDRVAGAGVMTDVFFTVTATAATLLREAPPLAPPFQPNADSVSLALPVMLGAIRASEGNDREAIVAWQNAADNGGDTAVIWPLMIDALLRLKDTARAEQLARQALTARPDHPRITRQLAVAYMLADRYDAALALLDQRLTREATDVEAQWLTLHALFATFVRGNGPGATPEGRARLTDVASKYVAAQGPHAGLARDWAAAAR